MISRRAGEGADTDPPDRGGVFPRARGGRARKGADAHGDSNTPATTRSGSFEGVSLAIATGHCCRDLWEALGNARPIPEAHVLLVGARDLDPGEDELLRRSAVQVVTAARLRTAGLAAGLEPALTGLRARTREACRPLDVDVLDSAEAPGVDVPVPGGLSSADLRQAIRMIGDRVRIRAATLAADTPDRDRDDRTLASGLDLLQAIADAATSTPR